MNTYFDNAINQLKLAADTLLMQNPTQCLQMANVFWQIGKFSDDDKHIAMGYRVCGNAYLFLGNYNEAIKNYEQASEIYKSKKDKLAAAQSLVGKASVLIYQKKYKESLALCKKLRKVFVRYQEWEGLLKIDKIRAQIYQEQGKYKHALKILSEAENLMKSTTAKSLLADIYFLQALIYEASLGRFLDARQEYEKAGKIYAELDLRLPLAKTENELGSIETRLGNFQKAIELLTKAIQVFSDLQMFDEEASALLNLCGAYRQQHLLPEALEICKKIIPKLEKRDKSHKSDSDLLPLFRFMSGIILREMGKNKAAMRQLSMAREMFFDLGDEANLGMIDNSIGVLYGKMGNYIESKSFVENAIKILSSKQMTRQLAYAEFDLGVTLTNLSMLKEAKSKLKSALKRAKYLPQLRANIYHQLGKIEEQQGRYKTALKNYLRGIDNIESLAAMITGNGSFQSSFFAGEIDIYQSAVGIYLKNNDVDSAFKLIERTKSRELSQLIFRDLDLSKFSDSPLFKEFEELRERLNAFYSATNEKHFRQTIIAQPIKKELEITERQIKKVAEKLRVGEGNFASINFFDFDYENLIEQANGWLSDDSVIIEYYFVQDRLMAFVIERGDLRVCELGVSKDKLASLINKLSFLLEAAKYDYQQSSIEETQAILQKLFDLLFAPLYSDLEGYSHLFIVPHSVLHSFPFSILYDGKDYLIKHFSISYAPSVKILNYYQQKSDVPILQKPPKSITPLVMGYDPGDIPYSIKETRAIKSIFPNCNYFEQDKATIQNLKKYSPKSDFVHISTHGQFRKDNPLFSSLQFAPSLTSSSVYKKSDYLIVYDIYYLQFKHTLITLSACLSGKNFVDNADELFGLARGFFLAGAVSLVASLWSVEDASTAKLMTVFYENIVAGENFGNALRNAKLQVMKTSPHPLFWGGFVLMGRNL